MQQFWDDVIEPLIRALEPRTLLDIPAPGIGATEKLLVLAAQSSAKVHVIDPAGRTCEDLRAKFGESLVYHQDRALNALSHVPPVDVALIDGEPNWFTVRSTLELIQRTARLANAPFPLLLINNVGWPYARRDAYPDPSAIPDAYRYPHRKAGLIPDHAEPVEAGGFAASTENSIYETNLRSGVLTAVEDFLIERGQGLSFTMTPAFLGLGVLYDPANAAHVAAVKALFPSEAAEASQRLIGKLERARIGAMLDAESLVHTATRAAADLAEAHALLAAQEEQIAIAQGEVREIKGELSRQTAELAIAEGKRRDAEEQLKETEAELKRARKLAAAVKPEPVATSTAEPPATGEAPALRPVTAAASLAPTQEQAPKAAAAPAPPPSSAERKVRRAYRRMAGLARQSAAMAWWGVSFQLADKLKQQEAVAAQTRLLQKSGLFDAAWYLDRYPDVARSGADPVAHFLTRGGKELRDPGPHFSTKWYLTKYPEIAKAGVNPLLDYLMDGAKAGRNPSPAFDTRFYLDKNPDVAKAGLNPLVHYVKFGKAAKRPSRAVEDAAIPQAPKASAAPSGAARLDQVRLLRKSGLVDPVWYLKKYPDVTGDAVTHYLVFGGKEGRDPGPHFAGKWYLERYPRVAEAGINPLYDYLTEGAAAGRDPNPDFNTKHYLEKYPDVAKENINPLVHFVKFGKAERRTVKAASEKPPASALRVKASAEAPPAPEPAPAAETQTPAPDRKARAEDITLVKRSGLFDAAWYSAQNKDAGADPALHFVSIGGAEGRDPSPHFSSKFYLETYPEVAQSGINPLVDYLTIGASAGRDPNPEFSSRLYLERNPDVARAAINPYVHYLKFGKSEGRRAAPHVPPSMQKAPAPQAAPSVRKREAEPKLAPRTAPAEAEQDGSFPEPVSAPLSTKPRRLDRFETISADIVVPIHNSPADVTRCLAALDAHRRANDRLILIDDGSDAETRELVLAFAKQNPKDDYIRNEQALGYTRAANQGIAASRGDYVVLLNSDTIVTPDWCAKLIAAGETSKKVGIVGPLSNAASWQSVPERFKADGDWAVNELPPTLDPALMGRLIDAVSPADPVLQAPLLNGFCFAIKRSLIEAIGALDEARFPEGYGEETDYCLRATNAGFTCAVALDAYVYHAKSRSFTHERRRVLTRQGNETLRERYGAERITAATHALRHDATLDATRQRVARTLAALEKERQPSVLFLLPVFPGSGGVHSIMQEAQGLARIGARIAIAVPRDYAEAYKEHYGDMLSADQWLIYDDESDLTRRVGSFQICVATVNNSIELLQRLCSRHQHMTPCYYAQDYEPLFYLEGSESYFAALRSYEQVRQALVFAKTDWIRTTIESRHDVRVFRVEPSLDRGVFYPPAIPYVGPVRVTAMVRITTARRGPERTLSVLRRLLEKHGAQVALRVFGAAEAEYARAGFALPPEIRNDGRLLRTEVAELMRDSDVFLDLSDYQAFGRTALEAMACAVAVVVPEEGGSPEFARHERNALIADTADENACFEAADRLVSDPDLRARIREAGLKTATNYSIDRAIRSELILFNAAIASPIVAANYRAAAE